MNRAVMILGVVLAVAGMSSAATLVIDNFEQGLAGPAGLAGAGISVNDPPGPPSPLVVTVTESGLSPTNVIGGVRRTTMIDLIENSQTVSANLYDPPGLPADNHLSLSANTGAQGQWLLEYGKAAGSTSYPFDLTAAGGADAIVFTFETGDHSASVDMWASDGTNSAGPVNKPTPGGNSTLTFLFSEFPGVDFSSIEDLSFRINGVLEGDYSISLLETRYHDDQVPEPVTMAALMMSIGGLGGYIRRRRR
ncbi:MAG TPA: PEP-CTERM sorting domain-containing protein [Phycisphaerae bacterium]|nr:PEP-CTERM sorting domain-containing protein [Phycisphaerae bacterium]HQL76163.1 PEP-CTERM sorting domain-containing protein [Phycisphaerae bacterium]